MAISSNATIGQKGRFGKRVVSASGCVKIAIVTAPARQVLPRLHAKLIPYE